MISEIPLAGIVDSPVVKRPGKPLPYVALEHIESGIGRIARDAEVGDRDPSDAARFQDGDVLFGKLRPYLHKVLHADFEGCCSTELLVLKARQGLNDRFLYYVALSAPFVAWADASSYGTKMPRTSWEVLRRFRISLPAVRAQAAIATFLDRETERTDRLVDKKRGLIELLEEKRTAFITHAVTQGLDPSVPMKDSGIPWLGDMPAHWSSPPLSRMSYQMTNGYVGPTRDILVPEGVPYVQSLHVKEGRIQHGADYFVSREWHLQHDRTRLREGDVLLVQTGDIGQSAVVGDDIAGSNCHALIITRLRPELADPFFVGYLLRSEGGLGSVLATRTGATHPHLNVGYVREVRFPVPPVEEQRVIVRHLDRQVEAIDRVVGKLRVQIDKLAEYRQALITAAVTGQIDDLANAAEPEETIA